MGKIALLYSGGKDSSVLLDLAIKLKKEIYVFYNNTGLADPRLVKFIREQTKGLFFKELTAPEPIQMWQRQGNFPILPKRTFNKYKQQIPGLRIQPIMCCYHLKEKPAAAEFIRDGINAVLWGNRAGESNRRKFAAIDHGFIMKPMARPWTNIYPLQHFTDTDILRYLKENNIRRPEETQLETGCICCGTDLTYWPNNLSRLFQKDRAIWEKFMRAGFAEQILKIKGIKEEPEKVIVQNPEILLKIEPGYRRATGRLQNARDITT